MATCEFSPGTEKCNQPAVCVIGGAHVIRHRCCEHHAKEWERITDHWTNPAIRYPVATPSERFRRQPPEFQAVIDRMKREVLADIEAGLVPATVTSYSELHDHVDANEYGGACEEGAPEINDETTAFWNRCQNAVHDWLQAGRPA